MSRVPSLSSPFLLGFDEIERVLDRVTKAADGYPPYNIERVPRDERDPERLRITLAVAGFTREQLDVSTEENQLVIRVFEVNSETVMEFGLILPAPGGEEAWMAENAAALASAQSANT